jgi:TonB family protein
MRLRFIASTCLAIAVTPVLASAQPDTEQHASATATPPKLVRAGEPAYPAAKKDSGESASVVLILTVDATGHVTNAEVEESGGSDFDTAALAASSELVFEPAQQGGKPMAARIPFRFDFAPPTAESSAAPTPAAAAPVAASAAPQPVGAPVAEPAPSEALDVDVQGERPPREATKRTLAAEEIQKLPGTNGDALRSLTNLPGVARPPGLDGLLIVRGSAPRDTQVFIDGTTVPLIYHLGGLSSVIPSEMLERIDFYPGNFGPQYGRGMGGIVDVGVRSPKKDKLHGLLQLDTVDARFIAEGPLSDSTRVMVGARRSWLDLWLTPVLRSNGVGVTAAPRYYDYQAMIEHDLSSHTSVRLFAFGADDRTVLTLNSPSSTDPAIGGDTSDHRGFWRVQGRIDTRPSSDVHFTTMLSAGHSTQDTSVGDLFVNVGAFTFEGRSDLRATLAPALTTVVGIDVQDDIFDAAVRLPPVEFDSDQNTGPLFGRPPVLLKTKGNVIRPAAYAMLEITPFAGLKLYPGVRGDFNQDTRGFTVDPRISVRYDVHPGFPRTTLKGGAGIFHQPPEPYQSIAPFGTPNIDSNKAYQYSAGVEQEFTRELELSLEGYYKDLEDLIVARPAAQANGAGQTYENTGSGRTYGGELLLRYKPTGRFFGWLAYTLSRSERRDGPGEPKYLFEFDQTHVLTALGSYKLGRGWQLGARFRYVTGSPYTPKLGGVMDYDAGVYSPISSPDRNSSRLPAFQQLDVRVDKTWTFKNFSLTVYADVQNVYNHKNVEAQGDNYNYSKTTPVYGLPLLPIIGIRGEL